MSKPLSDETGKGILRRMRQPRMQNWRIKFVAVFMSLLLVVAGYAEPVISLNNQVNEVKNALADFINATMGTEKMDELTLDQIAERLEKAIEELNESKQEISSDVMKLSTIISKVGPDPALLFEWVRDETFLVPYRGVLRGHEGVLMDQLGNSFDRALLLYALLREAEHEVRLAHGTLSPNQATEVLEKARSFPGSKQQQIDFSSDEFNTLIANLAQRYKANQNDLKNRMKKLDAEQKQLVEAVHRQVKEQAYQIADAVGRPKKDTEQVRTSAAKTVQDHWWVQWQNESSWINLDPTLPSAKPGQQLTKAIETIQPENYAELEDFCHSIRIRTVVEFWKKGKLQEAEVMNRVMLPMVMFGKHIVFSHLPPGWPQDTDLFQAENPPEQFKNAALKQREWLPVLSVDSEYIYKYSFLTDSSNIFDATLPAWAAAALKGREIVDAMEESTEGAGKRIKDLLGRRSRDQKPKEAEKIEGTHLTAEWIEYEINVPGKLPQIVRREVFDLLGPAARASGKENVPPPEITEEKRLERGLALLGRTEILPLVCRMSPEYVEHLMVENLLHNSQLFRDLIRSIDKADLETIMKQANSFRSISGQLYSLAMVRQQWGRFQKDLYLNRPNVFAYHRWFQKDAQGRLLGFQSFDIVSNHTAVHLSSDLDPFMTRVEQGVLDTNSEAVLAMLDGPKGEESGCCETSKSTADLFAASEEQGIEWMMVRSPQDEAWRALELPGDVRARIEHDLVTGYAAFVPQRPIMMNEQPSVSWWKVDPASGQTLGIGERGWGQTTTEYFFLALAAAHGTFMGCIIFKQETGILHLGDGELNEKERRALIKCGCLGIISFFSVVAIVVAKVAAIGVVIGYNWVAGICEGLAGQE